MPVNSFIPLFLFFSVYSHQLPLNVLCLRFQGYYYEWPKTAIGCLWLDQGGPLCYREVRLEVSYLLLATSSAVPDSVSPALVKRGDCSRQRTWYQWVRGSVGAVDSHTVILQRGRKRSAAVRPRQPRLNNTKKYFCRFNTLQMQISCI